MSKDKLICKHCDHEEHLNTKCYNKDCNCKDCHTKDDLRTLYRYDPDITAVFNGA